MKTKHVRRALCLLLAACLALGCAGCGGGQAASMFLRRAEGTVRVSDAAGGSVEPAEGLGLYSGYGLGTAAKSFAWIDLDRVKLAKLDENSEAAITKEGKALSIDVKTGSLFFHVAEPLGEDETMEIRASSMLVGIRGTCGWVDVPDAQHMDVYILEGTVTCTAGEKTASVAAGERAALTADGEITVEPFSVRDVPAFVADELAADEALNAAVLDASGLDVAGSPLRVYANYLAGIDGEIVLAEEIDFEADGSPELMVLYRNERDGAPMLHVDISRPGQGDLRLTNVNSHLTGLERLSLAESGGRTYLMLYNDISSQGADFVSRGEVYWYYGSTAQNDGGPSFWGRVDGVVYSIYEPSGNPDFNPYYARCGLSENGLRENAEENSSAEEYESVIAQYTEVRVLYEG